MIQPEDTLAQLRSAIQATALIHDVPLRRTAFVPHMTIAEFISIERTAELLQELRGNVPEGTFPCDAVEYAVPNTDFYFERVLTIPLGTGK